MAKLKDKLIIIDGNALVHRSFHALPPSMKNKSGELVNAVYGFAGALIKAIRDFSPKYIVLTLDKKGPTFRHKMFKDYKAQRIKAPDELYAQIPLVKALAKSFNIPVFAKSGFEADDLIGTICVLAGEELEKIILTGDMDTMQLVNAHTGVSVMSRGISESVFYDKKAVVDRYGLLPEQMIDYKALRGDPSDNIPGVRGVGEKTATKILKKYQSLENLYKRLGKKKTPDISERIISLLLKHKKEAFMSKELATIDKKVDINFDLASSAFVNFQKEKAIVFFAKMGFKSLLPRLSNVCEAKKSKEDLQKASTDKFARNKKTFKYSVITSESSFKKFFQELKKQKKFSFDTETSSLDPLTTSLLGISFSWRKGEAYYLVIKSRGKEVTELKSKNLFNYQQKKNNKESQLSLPEHPWLKKLKVVFADKRVKKNAHNAKFDIRVLRSSGVEVAGLCFDTMIASYLLKPGTRQHGLDALTFSELGHEKISKDDLLGRGKEKKSFSEVETKRLGAYSCEDADFCARLEKKLKPRLTREALKKLFDDIEIPLVDVLSKMEDRGIKLDTQFLQKMSQKVSLRIKRIAKEIYKVSGTNFNIRSTKQLREVLFEKLQIPTSGIKKTKTGYSTAFDELEKIKDQHSVIRHIQEHRELSKLLNTYLDALPVLVNPHSKRLHTSFNQTITATGRLSSSNPNLQNIPVRSELGREIRKAFVAEPGKTLLSLDYSQIELRLAAHMSGDAKMLKAFKNNADIHTSTAALINGVAEKEVSQDMRREAKALNFGILYGQGPHGFARTAEISYSRAKEFIEDYFANYQGLKKYIDKCIETAKKTGYAETMFGRRRKLPDINSSILMLKKAAERMAVNTPLQGTAADMIKVAMIKIHNSIASKDAMMLLQVHDELIFELKEEQVKKIAKEIKNIMEQVLKLKIPISVDAKLGISWGEMKKILL